MKLKACPRCVTGMVVVTGDLASPLRCVNCGACGEVIRPRTAEELAALTVTNTLPLQDRVGQRCEVYRERKTMSGKGGAHASV